MVDARRIAFLGIGHPLRRDDAAGVEVCDRLRPALGSRTDVLVVNGGSAPENVVGALRRFAPDQVIVLDAARMGQAPGTVRRIDPSDPHAWGASTHTLPMPVFCRYLEETLGCTVTLIGIEPADTSFGEGLTPEVQAAVEGASADALATLVAPRQTGALDGGWLSSASSLAAAESAQPPRPLRQAEEAAAWDSALPARDQERMP
ncbi:MAG TPA: hydrogenase 3 maturation endopeptidase HyCI [Anaerolineales bacterium]|nr:hydrogenase 3 maturation endopeptidase HyCI [Anaerolineales bacterium]